MIFAKYTLIGVVQFFEKPVPKLRIHIRLLDGISQVKFFCKEIYLWLIAELDKVKYMREVKIF